MRGVRLVGHGQAVLRGHPAAVTAAARIAGVPDGDVQRHLVRHRARGREDQVLRHALEPRRLPVDLGGRHLAVGEVQVDALQPLQGAGVDDGDRVERAQVVLVVEGQVVREHVVPGVPELREEPVSDAQRLRRGQDGGDEGEGGRGEQGGAQARGGELHPPPLTSARHTTAYGARQVHPNGAFRSRSGLHPHRPTSTPAYVHTRTRPASTPG